MQLYPFLLTAMPRALPAEELPLGIVITELIIAFLLTVATFLIPKKFLKILFISGAEVCLFLACKSTFGPHAVITQFMCWLTGAVACIVTIAFVNSVNWSNLRGRPGK